MFNIRITTKFQSNCPFRITNNPETLFKMHKISFNVFKEHWAETRNKTPSFLDVSRHRSNSENHLQGSWQSEERLEHSWCQGFQTSMEKRFILYVKVCIVLYRWAYNWKGCRTFKASCLKHMYHIDSKHEVKWIGYISANYFYSAVVNCLYIQNGDIYRLFLTWNWALMRFNWSVSV